MSACILCDSPAVEGDPLHLCPTHGGTTLLAFEATWSNAA